MHLWHEIAPVRKNQLTGVIEIPKGSNNKYSLDKELGVIRLDHTLAGPFRYPVNYGFVPQTVGLDGDPLDIIVFSQESFFPSVLVTIRPVGMVPLITDGEMDYKIIAVPMGDPEYGHAHTLAEIPLLRRQELNEFLLTYKDLKDEKTKVGKSGGRERAWAVIRKSMSDYHRQHPNPEAKQ